MHEQRRPTISLVVPVYNGERTLEFCLQSLATAVLQLPAERQANAEIIICDNHSTDGSLRIIEDFRAACPLTVVRPPSYLPNRTENWRFGLAEARGEWMAMVHADDALLPTALEAWLDAADSGYARQSSLIAARHRTFADEASGMGSPHPLFPLETQMSGRGLRKWVLPMMCPFVPFTLMRRTAYERVNGLDPRFELTQDWDLWTRMCAEGDVLYLTAVVGAWRLHPTGAAYQRINMQEHIARFAALEPTMPWATRAIARRGLRAKVEAVLQSDSSAEADRIRLEVSTLAPESGARWIQVVSWLTSSCLYAARAAGTARLALTRSRTSA